MISMLNIGYNGRLGNQIWQLASMIGISEKTGFTLVLPEKNTIQYQIHTLRNNVKFSAYFELNHLFDLRKNIIFGTPEIDVLHYINEGTYHFNSDLFCVPNKTSITGYLQSYKYFEHCENKVKEVLTIRPEIINSSRIYLPKTDKELVAIHIRRGDVATPNPYHFFIGMQYINKAMELFNSNDFHFVLCSDDPQWCREQFKGDNFTIIDTNNHYLDFSILSLCDHFIISNSSFSWWAAYLGKAKNKMVVAPKNWYGPAYSNLDTSTMYYKEWIIM